VQAAVRSSEEGFWPKSSYFGKVFALISSESVERVCRLLSEAVRRMTHEDIISLARAEHGHPMKLIDLAQVCFLLSHICIP